MTDRDPSDRPAFGSPLRLLLATGILAAVAVKAGFGLWLIEHHDSAPSWRFLCADVAPWAGFIRRILDDGRIPYVDFSREYPVGAGLLYGILGAVFGATRFEQTLRLQVGLSFVADLGSAYLLYRLARGAGGLRASLIALLWLALPSVVILSPVRFESTVALLLLGGYAAHRAGKPLRAVAIWSLGVTLKWYPAIAIAVQQLGQERTEMRRNALKAFKVMALVLLWVNAPFVIASLILKGDLYYWLNTYRFHSDRHLAPDTVLGASALWIGELPCERFASWLSLAAAAAVLLTRRQMPWAAKVALVCMALLVLNRVYSPQFNLWFYPPLLLAMASADRRNLVALCALLVALDLFNAAIFPFAYAGVVDELGRFRWGTAAAEGGPWTVALTLLVWLRALALLAIALLLYLLPPLRVTGTARPILLPSSRVPPVSGTSPPRGSGDPA